MNTLQNIGTGYGASFGSIVDIQMVSANNLSFPWKTDLQNFSATVAVINTGFNWLQLKPAVNRFFLKDKSKEESAGTMFETELTGTVLTDTDATRDALLAMVFTGLVLVVTNGDGQRRIIGNKGKPARASLTSDTGQSLKESTSFQLTVSWRSLMGATPYSSALAASTAGNSAPITPGVVLSPI